MKMTAQTKGQRDKKMKKEQKIVNRVPGTLY